MSNKNKLIIVGLLLLTSLALAHQATAGNRFHQWFLYFGGTRVTLPSGTDAVNPDASDMLNPDTTQAVNP